GALAGAIGPVWAPRRGWRWSADGVLVRPACHAGLMKRTISTTGRAIDVILRGQCDLITRSQALAAGMTDDALRHKLGEDGPWRIVLPGVYLSHNGLLTGGQREAAAVLYAGRGCVITGLAALARQGVRVPFTEIVDVLIPHRHSRQSAEFVRVHR